MQTHAEQGVIVPAGLRPRSFINVVQSGRDAFHTEYLATLGPWRLLPSRSQAKAPGAQEESLDVATNGGNSP